MSGDDMAECLRLLDAADDLLLAGGENVLAAHLSAVIETLRGRSSAIVSHAAVGSATH